MKKIIIGISAIMILTACNTNTKDDEEYQSNINKGLEAIAEDNFGKAEALFEIALEAKPKDASAKAYLEQVELIQEAEAAKEENKIQDALEALEKAISTKSGSKVIISKAEEQKEEIAVLQENKEKEEVMENSEKVTSTNEVVEKQIVVSKRDEYIQKLNNIEIGLVDLEYLYENGITSEMKEAESITYERWDDALNEIYGVLKTQLSTNEMEALRQEQRQWIKDRDNTANEDSLVFEGGTMESLQYISTLSQLTKERCYELVYDYMK